MNRIIKYLLTSFFIFCFLNINILSYKDNNSFLLLKDNSYNYSSNDDNNIDSGKYFFMELFCGVIGLFMVIMALKTTEKD